jgi:dTDP-4-amino-4,6-dideoxygalactose transaminase
MTMAIPLVDLKAGYLEHKAVLDQALARVLASGWYIMGKELESFETEFAAWQGANHAIGVANGTDAIELALRACGIGPGDAVFTVSHTAVATVAAIERCGACPVLVDIEPERFTMDPLSLAAAVPRVRAEGRWKPRAVVAVHLYGQPAAMPAILAVAREQGLRVIEDCAQAHGAALQGRMVGLWGDLAAYSFYPTKNLGALGDGGAVTCQDPALADRLRALRQYGWRERYISAEPGVNSRLDEIQAAVLRHRLTHLDQDNRRRQALARQYVAGLASSGLGLPLPAPGADHVYHLFVVQSDRREGLRKYLAQHEISTALHYPQAVHQQPAYVRRLPRVVDLSVTESAVARILSLPMYPQLPASDAHRVIEACLRWARSGN